ncbi:MAG: fibronectin type III domain-containing protein, partial [Spirochaetales bacterium]|nr:fibronectin type III domain-containing protein [Spirochaetales bacterium]
MKSMQLPSGNKIISITGIFLFLFILMPISLYAHNNSMLPLHLVAAPRSSCQVNLQWTDIYSNETGFQIFRKSGIIDRFRIVHTTGADETSWIDTSVTPGTFYCYFIKPLIPQRNWFFPYVYVATPRKPWTPPASPMNLSALAAGPDRVRLEWTDLSDNEYGFRIERKIPGGEFITVTEVLANVTGACDDCDTFLPGTDYIYRVIAFNPSGDSYPANEVKVTIPHPPMEIPAAPGNPGGIPVSINQVSLTWTDNAYNETSYFLERRENNKGEFTLIMEIPPDTENYLDTGLESHTTYHYRIRAGNSKGFSNYTQEVDVTTMSSRNRKPEAPSYLISIAKSAVQIDLTWIDNSDNEFGFIIQRSERNMLRCWGPSHYDWNFSYQNIAIVHGTSWSDMDVCPGTFYEYRVFAFNDRHRSSLSKSTLVCTPELPVTLPEPPSNVKGIPVSARQIELTWNDNAYNEYGFLIQRKIDREEYRNIKILPPDVLKWIDKEVNSFESYTYRILTFNAAGQSSPSNEVIVYPQLPPAGEPVSPSHLEVIPLSATQMKLLWIDNSYNEYGFGIERRIQNNDFQLAFIVLPNVSNSSVEVIDTGLLPGTEYTYRVFAYNEKGNSAYSNKAYNKTFPLPHESPFPPEIIKAESITSHKTLLTWICNADNEEGFIIQRKMKHQEWITVHVAGVDVDEWVDNRVVPDTSCMYRLAAFNYHGQSNWSKACPVTPCVESRIVFTVQPSDTLSGDIISPVIVEIQDNLGNIIPDATNSITVSVGINPANGILSGTLTKNAVNGKAVFNDLSIDNYGQEYTLKASPEGLSAIQSDLFDILPLSLTVKNNGYGETIPTGTIPVSCHDQIPVTAQAQTGYHFVQWIVDNGTAMISNPDAAGTTVIIDHGDASITATFEMDTYSIIALSGPEGTINPSGEVIVQYGDSQEFIIAPFQNYHIQEIIIDGTSIEAGIETRTVLNTMGSDVFNYTFDNVTGSHTIEAYFAQNTYTIAASAGENGSITPAGDVVVSCGETAVFTIIPGENYHIADVVVDGV